MISATTATSADIGPMNAGLLGDDLAAEATREDTQDQDLDHVGEDIGHLAGAEHHQGDGRRMPAVIETSAKEDASYVKRRDI
jgi:hypothetical protein